MQSAKRQLVRILRSNNDLRRRALSLSQRLASKLHHQVHVRTAQPISRFHGRDTDREKDGFPPKSASFPRNSAKFCNFHRPF